MLSCCLLSLGCAALATPAFADDADGCSHFSWDVSHELKVMKQTAVPVTAATKPGTQAPAIQIDKLYELKLSPQSEEDAHPPHPWRTLTASEQARFDTGYAVFNTEWAPANTPAGRIDGLGPLFNSRSCDSCHNSRRRGRGPRGDGEAPSDLVIQLGQRVTRTRVVRGNPDCGYVLNTSAIQGFRPEARVSIEYKIKQVTLGDGTVVELREPRYHVDSLDGPKLPPNTVLMPRMPPPVQGAGLLELVPSAEMERVSRLEHDGPYGVRGRVSWLQGKTDKPVADAGRVAGRFGWQASEPSVASQIRAAFAREMGLTNPLESKDDCGPWNGACRTPYLVCGARRRYGECMPPQSVANPFTYFTMAVQDRSKKQSCGTLRKRTLPASDTFTRMRRNVAL
jgi:CxxC motif-containing protein (DUF1111 family)